jgi:hypothetical protein
MPKKKSTEAQPRTEATPTSGQEESASSGFERAAVVGLPKFNPHARPTTTEQVSTVPIRQSYEDIQETAKGPGVEEWREADKLRANLSAAYQALKEDECYAEAYKSERAWAEYEKTRAKIEELVPAAREKMLRSADTLERLSIPVPEHQGLITKDTDKLLLTAHERSRLEGLINRAEQRAKGPFKAKPVDILAREYERGLHEGGPGGGATVRAAYELARDWGLDIHAIVDAHRKPRHHGAFEDAQQARRHAQMVSRSVPQPPFPHPERISQERGRAGTYGSAQKGFIPQEKGMLFAKKRRRSWK